MSVQAPGPSSLDTASSVSVPASTRCLSIGHGCVASLVGSPGCPIVTSRRHFSGCCRSCAIISSNKWFLSACAPCAGASATIGCNGSIAHRTGVDTLAAFTKRNALRLLNVLSAKLEEMVRALMSAVARAVSG